jgi:hypothetical protein
LSDLRKEYIQEFENYEPYKKIARKRRAGKATAALVNTEGRKVERKQKKPEQAFFSGTCRLTSHGLVHDIVKQTKIDPPHNLKNTVKDILLCITNAGQMKFTEFHREFEHSIGRFVDLEGCVYVCVCVCVCVCV